MTAKDTVNIKNPRKIPAAGILKAKAVLLILSENYLGKTFILDTEETVIGRGEDSDFRIDDPLVSGRHCRIFFTENGHFEIEDLESMNSTYINNKAIKKPVLISYGDRIIIGNTIMRFFHEEKLAAK